jgi:glycerophosphoryl diester phosphodiesterase
METRRAPEWLTRWEYAHRGLHSPGVPENSRAAAEAAIVAGLGIECDIQRSRDDHPMVFHDWELARLTGESGEAEGRTVEELEALHLLATEQHPVRLAHFLEAIAGRVPLLIEIKSRPGYDVERTCVYVARLLEDYAGDCAVMSFDPRVGEWFAQHAPAMPRGLVITDTLEHGFKSAWRAPHALERAAPDFLTCDVRDLPNAITSLWRETGRPVLTWTVRSPETRARGMAHADALIAEGAGLA